MEVLGGWASMGVKEAEMEKVWGTKRERKKQKDVWPQTQAAEGARKYKGADQIT